MITTTEYYTLPKRALYVILALLFSLGLVCGMVVATLLILVVD